MYETSNASNLKMRDAKTLVRIHKNVCAEERRTATRAMNELQYFLRTAAKSIRIKEQATVSDLGPSAGRFQTFSTRVDVVNGLVRVFRFDRAAWRRFSILY